MDAVSGKRPGQRRGHRKVAGQGGGGRRGRAGQAQDGPVIRPRWSTYLSCQALSDVTRGFRFGWWQGQGPQGVLAPSLHGPPQGPVPRGDRGGPRVCACVCGDVVSRGCLGDPPSVSPFLILLTFGILLQEGTATPYIH